MAAKNTNFNFLQYLAENAKNGSSEGSDRIPSLVEISKNNGVSIASLREQLGVARALGLVEVRPKTGIRRLPYRFAPAVSESLDYALQINRDHFDDFADMRNHIEAAYWDDAVQLLTTEDKNRLVSLVDEAQEKLNSQSVQLPHSEHRELHLTIYNRLENPFVLGILEAYWDAYEQVGLNRYKELKYLKRVWEYHRGIVDAICEDEFSRGYSLLVEHMDLIGHRYVK